MMFFCTPNLHVHYGIEGNLRFMLHACCFFHMKPSIAHLYLRIYMYMDVQVIYKGAVFQEPKGHSRPRCELPTHEHAAANSV